MKTLKTLFIPAKIKSSVNKSKILGISKQLPKNIAIAYSIQYIDIAKQIKSILSKQGKHNIIYFEQVLGCSKLKLKSAKKTDCILLIGSGRFHAMSLTYQTELPIYILEQNNLYEISKNDIKGYKKRQKAAYLKYLNSDKIGILISIKPGQFKLKKALNLKNKIPHKKIYFFVADNINSHEFENFSDINSWINTACPRLDMDIRVININNLNIHSS